MMWFVLTFANVSTVTHTIQGNQALPHTLIFLCQTKERRSSSIHEIGMTIFMLQSVDIICNRRQISLNKSKKLRREVVVEKKKFWVFHCEGQNPTPFIVDDSRPLFVRLFSEEGSKGILNEAHHVISETLNYLIYWSSSKPLHDTPTTVLDFPKISCVIF